MTAPLKPLAINKIGVYGVMRENEVDSSLIPDGALTGAQNWHFDRKGAATVRLGLTALGATVIANMPTVGLFNAQSGTAIAAFSNGAGGTSAIYTFSNGAWGSSLDGGTASVSIRFVDFASYTIAINFMSNTYTSMRFWNAGSSRHWHFTGSPINPQNMWGYSPQFGDVFKSRVYLFSDITPGGSGAVASNKSRLFFSSVISGTGSITWNPASDWVDINPGDGEDGSGLKRYGLELLCFKPNYIYRFKTTGVDPDPLVKIGTRSNESIVEGKRGLYFHHDTGFFQYTGSTLPTEISRPISDIVAAIPYSQFKSIVGWRDSDHIYWSIGTVTVSEPKENVTYKNAVIRYTESSQVWTVYSYSSDIRRGMTYNNGSTLTRIVGLDNGVVATQDSGNTDMGEPIKYRMMTKWYNWGSNGTNKTIEELFAICEKAQAAQLFYRTDEMTEWKQVGKGQLTRFNTPFVDLNLKFHRIKFMVAGVCRFEPPVFLGIEIMVGLDEGVMKEPQ